MKAVVVKHHKAATPAEFFSKLKNHSFDVNDLWLIFGVAASQIDLLKSIAWWYFLKTYP